jgi:hypothetical protein
MKKPEHKAILGGDLRPARDEAEKVHRGMFINRARVQREEIEQYFRDGEHWNRLHPGEEIDLDPDGRMRQLASDLDGFITRNSEVH